MQRGFKKNCNSSLFSKVSMGLPETTLNKIIVLMAKRYICSCSTTLMGGMVERKGGKSTCLTKY